jgi:hypothetical protein
VASRGNLAGKIYPMKSQPQSSRSVGSRSEHAVSQAGVYSDSLDPGPSTPLKYDQKNARKSALHFFSPIVDHRLVEEYTSTTVSEYLFTHFNISVAPRLTWVDGPDHPWRSLMFPLAQRCSCLRLSILSVAAAHLSFTSPENQPKSTEIQTMNGRLRDASLRVLNGMIRLELDKHSSSDSSEVSPLIEILATTLVLCYGEMLVPNSTDWNLHLRACRALIERYRWRTRRNEPKIALQGF